LGNKRAYARKRGFAESPRDRAGESSNEDNDNERDPIGKDDANENEGDENGLGDEDYE
jgi:hypothetical protein